MKTKLKQHLWEESAMEVGLKTDVHHKVLSEERILRETSKRITKDKKKANAMIIPSASKKEPVINQYETVKYTINVNDSADFFNKKDFFPQELRSYIELLNKLFKRQNDIITGSPGRHTAHKREPIELPEITEHHDFQKTALNIPNVGTKRKEEDIVKYLTHGVRSQTAPAGAEKKYIVAMAGAKKKKGGTKKGKKGKGGKDEEESDDDDSPDKGKKSKKGKKKGDKTKQEDDRETAKKSQTAVMTYQLSDLANLKNGISAVPSDTYTRKIISFRAEPSKPEISCFRSRPIEEVYYYDSNLIAGLISTEGTGYIMYPNRDIAIEITRGRIGKKVVVYTESKTDKLGNYFEQIPVAIFDDIGNGAVYDNYGKIRLNYDQGEGVLYDTPSRLPFYWKWNKSQFLIQRRGELRFVEEDEPDFVVEDEEEAGESQEKTPDQEKGQKKQKKKGTAKKKSKKGKRAGSESESDEEEDEDEKSKKDKKKGGKKSRRKSAKGDRKKSGKKSGRKSESVIEDLPKEGRKSKKKGRASGRLLKRGSTLSAKARLGKLKAMMDMKGERKRVIPPVSKPPTDLIPITDLKPLAVKITDHISLRIMNQGHIHIDFAYSKFHITLYLGMTVYPEILERIDKITLDPNDKRRVPCYFEFLHKRTYSLIELNSKRNQMLDKGKRERYRKLIKQAYTMGTYIYLRKKKLTSREQIDSLAHRNADQLKVNVD